MHDLCVFGCVGIGEICYSPVVRMKRNTLIVEAICPDTHGNTMEPIVVPKRGINKMRVTITIYFINPSGKLKLSFDRTTKNISHNSKS